MGIGKTINPETDGNNNVDPTKANSFGVKIVVTDGLPLDEVPDPDVTHRAEVDMTIEVKPQIDEDPVFEDGKTSHEYEENGTDSVYTFTAYDPEDADVDLTLSGPDKDKFEELTAAANANDPTPTDTWDAALTFVDSPNYEKPDDANKDGIYEITVTASATSSRRMRMGIPPPMGRRRARPSV